MFGLFDSLLRRPARTKNSHMAQPRRLSFQPLETRDLMAAIPVLNSLPNAPKTLYLDFDGDFQKVWNRTDETPQQYRSVSVGEFNIDGQAGISDAEATAIRKIWETVADDYAPFNINVTTVAPASFQNGTALRVVMAGDCTAQLVTGRNTSLTVSGDRFISDGAGGLVDTSGYASIGSFSDAEPNVVYVFAKYMSTWNMVDSEGHSRDLRAIIGTTASHEAGHSFGLVHHGNLDLGSPITTPIMGSNTQGDRTIWSKHTIGFVVHDNLAKLTSRLGARPDDFGSNYKTAPELQFTTYSPVFGYRASFAGVIGTTSDVDMFKLTVSATTTYNINVTVPQFGNLDSQLLRVQSHQGSDPRLPLPEHRHGRSVHLVDPAVPGPGGLDRDQPAAGYVRPRRQKPRRLRRPGQLHARRLALQHPRRPRPHPGSGHNQRRHVAHFARIRRYDDRDQSRNQPANTQRWRHRCPEHPAAHDQAVRQQPAHRRRGRHFRPLGN